MGMTKKEREARDIRRMEELRRHEDELHSRGIKYIAGIDEVGRGPLAGPVYAAAVVLPEDWDIPGLYDSKKLTEKKRNEMSSAVMKHAMAVGIGTAASDEIDRVNILNATREAMTEAVKKADEDLKKRTGDREASIEYLLIDAVHLDGIDIPEESIVKGDASCLCISAASVVAKVARDSFMKQMDKEYPGYGFASNKGYGTREHYEGIERNGISPIHRRTFLKTAEKNIEKIHITADEYAGSGSGGRMKGKKVYAVRKGRKTGIFDTWDECKRLVTGYPGAEYKSFKSPEDAESYLSAGDGTVAPSKGYEAYVDGSFDASSGRYSCGCVILRNGSVVDEMAEAFDKNDNSQLRNVAGEIMGARRAIEYALGNDIDEITIYHDYAGIGRWGDGEWKTNREMTRDYRDFVKEARKKVRIHFIKVTGHSGVKYNERADELAGKVLK